MITSSRKPGLSRVIPSMVCACALSTVVVLSACGQIPFRLSVKMVLDASGKVIARVRFTDIFVYRDGRWQAVAGHETLITEEKK